MPAERWRREFIACPAAVDEIACGVPAFTLDISGPRIRPDVAYRIERDRAQRELASGSGPADGGQILPCLWTSCRRSG
jgi:hypothetical protein